MYIENLREIYKNAPDSLKTFYPIQFLFTTSKLNFISKANVYNSEHGFGTPMLA